MVFKECVVVNTCCRRLPIVLKPEKKMIGVREFREEQHRISVIEGEVAPDVIEASELDE